jgi:chromosome segregation ATPase
MKSEKPERNVANMDVLKDIRGLLSTPLERKASMETESEETADLKIKIAQYEEEIKRYGGLIQNQQEELERLRRENKELAANLNLLQSDNSKLVSPQVKVAELNQEIAQLEAKKSELASVISEVEGLLQLRLQELLKQIARVYQEIGQGEMAIEFRKAADQLEVAENLAHFLQVLLER